MSIDRDTIVYNNIWNENHKYNDIPKEVKELSRGRNKIRVLDLCAGGGRNTIQFLKDGHFVYAVDRNDIAVKELNGLSKQFSSIEVEKTDAVHFLCRDERIYDIVIVFDCIHHFSTSIDNLVENLELIKKRIDVGGKLLITFLADIKYPGGNDNVKRLYLDKITASNVFKNTFKDHYDTIVSKEEPVYFKNAQNIVNQELVTGEYQATRLLRVYERKKSYDS